MVRLLVCLGLAWTGCQGGRAQVSHSPGRFFMDLSAGSVDADDDTSATMTEATVEGRNAGARVFYVETDPDALVFRSRRSGVDWIDGFVYYRTPDGVLRLGGFYTSFHASDRDARFDIDPQDPGREVKTYGILATGSWRGRLAGTDARGLDWFAEGGLGVGRAELSYKDIDSGNTTAWRAGGRIGVAARLRRWSLEAGWRGELLHTANTDSFSSGDYTFHGAFFSAVFTW